MVPTTFFLIIEWGMDSLVLKQIVSLRSEASWLLSQDNKLYTLGYLKTSFPFAE